MIMSASGAGTQRPLLALAVHGSERASTTPAPVEGHQQTSTRINVLGYDERSVVHLGFEQAVEALREACGQDYGPNQGPGDALVFEYGSDWLHFCVKTVLCDDKHLKAMDLRADATRVSEILTGHKKHALVDSFRIAMQQNVKEQAWITLALVLKKSMTLLSDAGVLATAYVFGGAQMFGRHFFHDPNTDPAPKLMWHKYANDAIVAPMSVKELQTLYGSLQAAWKEHQYNVAVALFILHPKAQTITIDESDGTRREVLYTRAKLVPPGVPSKARDTLFY